MKRKEFIITLNGEYKGTRYAWNSAREAVRAHIRQYLPDNTSAEIIEKEYKKDEFGRSYIHAIEKWKISTGEEIIMEINLKSV